MVKNYVGFVMFNRKGEKDIQKCVIDILLKPESFVIMQGLLFQLHQAN